MFLSVCFFCFFVCFFLGFGFVCFLFALVLFLFLFLFVKPYILCCWTHTYCVFQVFKHSQPQLVPRKIVHSISFNCSQTISSLDFPWDPGAFFPSFQILSPKNPTFGYQSIPVHWGGLSNLSPNQNQAVQQVKCCQVPVVQGRLSVGLAGYRGCWLLSAEHVGLTQNDSTTNPSIQNAIKIQLFFRPPG